MHARVTAWRVEGRRRARNRGASRILGSGGVRGRTRMQFCAAFSARHATIPRRPRDRRNVSPVKAGRRHRSQRRPCRVSCVVCSVDNAPYLHCTAILRHDTRPAGILIALRSAQRRTMALRCKYGHVCIYAPSYRPAGVSSRVHWRHGRRCDLHTMRRPARYDTGRPCVCYSIM
jgi:hypothetical protein